MAVGADEILLTLDVPGLTAEDLSIEADGDQLVVRGERKRPELGDSTTHTHVERPFGAFERRVQIPRGIDPDRITADLENGVLTVTVPKPEHRKPKAITIGSGARQLESANA